MTAAKWCGDTEFEKVWSRFFTEDFTGLPVTLGTIYADAKAAGWNSQNNDRRHFLSDMGNAACFAEFVGGRLRYVHGLEKWLVWMPELARWLFCQQGEEVETAKACVTQMLRDAASETNDDQRTKCLKHALLSQSAARLDAMIKLAESELSVRLTAEKLDRDPWLLGVSNGVVNLRTGMLRAAQRDDFITKHAGTAYDSNANCPNFQLTLDAAFAGDQALISYFQRAFGSALCGILQDHVFWFIFGSGANGKSTLCNAIQSAFGDYAITLPTEALMQAKRDAGAASPELMMLRGVRLAIANETEDGQRLAESRIKQLTGGDRITARALYGGFVEFLQTASLAIVGNHKPQISGTDGGIWRRVQLIPFEVTIPEAQRDRLLPQKLQAELPGILAWLVRGCLAWQKHGLMAPLAVLGATAAYRQESDILNEFITECCTVNPTANTASGEMYRSYRNWAIRNGHAAWHRTRWGRRMSERFSKGSNGTTRTYAGVELNATGQMLSMP